MVLNLNTHSIKYIMEILKEVMFAVVIMGLVIVGLATQIIFKKDGKFLYTSIGANKYMKDRGVTCARTFDKMEKAKARKQTTLMNLYWVNNKEWNL